MIFNAFERMMAGRYLRARRKEGFVSVIAGFSLAGIGLGVATLIIVMAVMNGFREDLMGRIFGLNGHLTVLGQYDVMMDYDRATDIIRGIPGVRAVTPTVEGQVMLTDNGRSVGGLVRGVRPEDLRQRPMLANAVIAGSLDDLRGQDSIMIGNRLAENFGLRVGDKLTLVSPKGKVTAMGTVPRVRAYTVRVIFSIGMSEYDSSFVFLPLEAAQTYFQVPTEGVNHLEVVVDHPDRVGEVAGTIASTNGLGGIRLRDWRQTNATFFNALQVERNVMFLILTLIIVVAAFNIISGLIMLVKDKGRDIAILRTMGASRGAIMRIFFLAGAAVGVTGTLAGLLLGVLFCQNIEAIRQGLQSLLGVELFNAEIYFLATMPATMDPHEVMNVVLMALGLSFAATLYPAWRAARTDPVEALRNE
ncbi:lipoprotein-releasing ABC transporter permease subunit [Rhodospirillum rubrum]|uniref:Lipoprotein releasing system, transmembrane protein, LolC/E family n=1 Tax=Rhodospirillum rubrum (strain ATCC 11170 / ATH 1.1.1 / DSM 467 / LMG 4362 / NCIMB 8255 / S1) TaxID=269796 RepID=Q2RU17_RHORT|nr:lipoprotein-releasing ABC transporter permease subunit [Rhodospirillum rubrum]ABC22378.1 Lipoprotein releasing system, transmembrane protein, LolC/E family [Rhodospirillum rubrum ATCC 11170]AEO48095.1 LolC/E family lipoprotein releasing system, transmembrane protein [Rhodospirillum rubrum F11]MBK5953958.1 lipoprotein-releasing system transmembrane subunit LolC [Rhodospirillum rubrum]QXG82016.1 lipoprotein-releasing ABC transporter permease subunit [Rhodospirillum rubrum]HAQ00735.1 lipoprote